MKESVKYPVTHTLSFTTDVSMPSEIVYAAVRELIERVSGEEMSMVSNYSMAALEHDEEMMKAYLELTT